MKKIIFLTAICLVGTLMVSAQQGRKTFITLEQPTLHENLTTRYPNAVAKAKLEIERKNKEIWTTDNTFVTMPKQAATKISIDVKGLSQIVLATYGKQGGEVDRAVWGNGRFVKNDGTSVWLEDMKDIFGKDGFGALMFGVNGKKETPKIGAISYTHSVLTYQNSQIVVPLDKKYVRFEAEIGVQTRYTGGESVTFKVQASTGKEQAQKLLREFPMESYTIMPLSENALRQILTTPNALAEKAVAQGIGRRLTIKSYFDKRLAQVDQQRGFDAQVENYLSIAQQAFEISKLQTSIEWINIRAIERAYADMAKDMSFDTAVNGPKLTELKALVATGFEDIYNCDINRDAFASAKRAIELKRQILLANAELDVDKIIVGRYKMGAKARSGMAPEIGTQTDNWSNQTTARRTGFDATIEELSKLRSTEPSSRLIFKPTNGSSVPDITLHWNAERVLFSMADSTSRWQVYEVPVVGGGAKQMTHIPEPDLEFFDATYLPDGRMLVISNIGYNGVPCVDGSDEVGNLCLYDPKSGSLRRLTFDQDANWGPVVMNNGRIMYTRWEYTDLVHYFSRFVMHMNPDGTEQKSLYGSGAYFPNSTFDMKPLPGKSSRFVGIISGHHGVARSGRLILFDPAMGRKSTEGMTQEIPYHDRKIIPIIKDRMVDDVWPQFVKPYPLNENYFLVTAKLNPTGLWGIYLVDIFDNVTLIAEYEGEGLTHPTIVKKRPVPPVIPDRIVPESKESTIFIQDIYEGEGLVGVPRGTIKSFRVYAYEYAYVRSPSNHYAQGIQSGWDIKRLLGTVAVEQDGSMQFTIPANTPLSLQPLDSLGRAVQWMRSWVTGQPGEVVSCVGCHEDQNKIAMSKRVIASMRPARKIDTPEGGVRSFTFDLEVQPILDRACISCHNGNGNKSDFTGGQKDGMGFGKSYLNLHPYVRRQGPEAEMPVMNPYEYHVNTSPLIDMLTNGHYGVQLTDSEWRKLYTWIDMNAPDKGMFKATTIRGFDQIARRKELMDKYANGMGVDWQKEIKDYADYLNSKPKPEPVKPLQKNVVHPNIKVAGWPFDKAVAQTKAATENRGKKSVELAPGLMMNFVWIPAGTFVMGSNKGNSNYAPTSKQTIEKGFWMGELEVSNEQFAAFFPKHDSRFVAQQWKDHTTPGYAANLPEQPATRMTWEEAMEYCRIFGQKSGLKMTLPTEAQWEWACRGGSETDFWYGNLNTDFSKFENLSDRQVNKLAVTGIDPQPISESNFWYKYYAYHPKENSVDDGSFIMVKGGKYESNPWGLYDMHGNVEEWTRSDYNPYPYVYRANVKNADKVARGGSWIDHPKLSTSYYRHHYMPWQKVHNVGFRVIIEE